MQRVEASGGVVELVEWFANTCEGVKYVVGTRLRAFTLRGGDTDLERDGCEEGKGISIGVVASLLNEGTGPARQIIGSVCLTIVTREPGTAGVSLVAVCL